MPQGECVFNWRAHFVLLTRVDLVDPSVLQDILREIRRRAGDLPVASVRFTPKLLKRHGDVDRPANWLEGKRVFAFCGIGNPSGFWRTLERLGATIVEQRGFPDHYGYQREDVEDLERWGASNTIDAVVMTQKDAVKIPIGSLAGRPLLSLCIEAEIVSGEESLLAALDRVAPLHR
ncbi:MAG: tetraacyldisaccharide 4'-kinase [Planctomycetota bacterium]